MEFIETYHINLIFRIIISCICGILIGFERKNRAKEAGVRTHCIVACASALMMIISKYGFYDIIQNASLIGADVRLDPSRLAQGIVTGVGFLGAGMIYIQRGSIRGLTTSSGIWATCGIGMAIGFAIALVAMATLREVFGAGSFFGIEIPFIKDYTIPILTSAPGGFFVFGLLIAIVNKIMSKKRKPKTEFGCEGCPSASACNKTECEKEAE